MIITKLLSLFLKNRKKGASKYPGYQKVLEEIEKTGNKAKVAQKFGVHYATIFSWYKKALKEKEQAENSQN